MYSSHLRKHVLAHDGLVGGYGYARIALHEAAYVVEPVFVDARLGVELVLQYHLYARQRGVAATFAQSVDGDVQPFCSAQHRRKRVAHSQVVVVVGVEVEPCVGITFHHLAEILYHLHRVHDAKRVGKHEAAYARVGQSVHHLVDILRRILHSVAPVLKIQVDRHALRLGVGQRLANVVDVLFGRLVQLLGAVAQRPLGQEVDHPATAVVNPVDGEVAVDEAKHLHPVQLVYLAGVAAYHLHGVLLAVGHARRGHLDAVHVDILEQHARNHQLLVRQKRHAARLLSIAQCAVHYLDERRNALVSAVHLLRCSHASILSLFCRR